MNAVAALARKATPKAPPKARGLKTPAQCQTSTADEPNRTHAPEAVKDAFWNIACLLDKAHHTDEPHGWSGDSNRLLRIAQTLADTAANSTPQNGEAIDCAAFDIAALIRAARLVPGDEESTVRRALIDEAATHLNWLTKCDQSGEDCCDPGAPRPKAPNATLAARTAESPVAAPASAASEDTSAERAYYRLREAAAVIRAAADDDATTLTGEALWATVKITELCRDSLPLGEVPTFADLSDTGAKLAGVMAVLELIRFHVEDVPLVDAGVALLTEAQRCIGEAEGEVRHA